MFLYLHTEFWLINLSQIVTYFLNILEKIMKIKYNTGTGKD